MIYRAMVITPIKKAVLLLLFVGTLTALDAVADKVVLKDGKVEESARVWETDRYVHFILKGTRSVEIRYAKEIVDHIEGADGATRSVIVNHSGAAPESVQKTQAPASMLTSEKKSSSAAPLTTTEPPQADKGKLIRLDRAFIERNRNLSFYDPRRPQRYWADRQSQHAGYAAAMAVLATQYDHSIDWIEKHMGQENDLGAIHASLIAALEAEATSIGNQAHTEQGPNEPPKDTTTPASVENQGDQVPQEHPAQPTPMLIKVGEGSPSPVPAIPSGISFYDPRRPQKYWASPKDHCASLQEAIQLLAKIYGVPTTHIESNLGESNDLSQIHANIQKSLGMVQK